MKTLATMFSGGELLGVGARTAGFKHIWGIEFDSAIADVARANGFHSIVSDVRTVDLAGLERPDVLHASPVCKNASNAKADAAESAEDIETADAVCRFIHHFKPDVLTLENVFGYRKFQAFANICKELRASGYRFDYWHLNSADYGVPQTRKRLILIARRDGKPVRKPQPTHTECPRPMFEMLSKWVGWYEAIEDLIPTLPESKFAKWQLERLPAGMRNLLVNSAFLKSNGKKHYETSEPAMTVDTTMLAHAKALLVDSAGFVDADSRQAVQRDWDEPANVIVANHAIRPMRAFLMDGIHGGMRTTAEPSTTLVGTEGSGVVGLRAFLVNQSSTMEVREAAGSAASQVASERNAGQVAFIVDGKLNDRSTSMTVRDGLARSQTVTTSHNNRDLKAHIGGRVVRMTPRALARFQSLPDSYVLPDKDRLAVTVIGNAVPCLLAERIYREILSV